MSDDIDITNWQQVARRFTGRRKFLAEPKDAHGMCAIQSDVLWKHLKGRGGFVRVTGGEYAGREHWAVLIPNGPLLADDGAIVIDVTARQFRADAPFPHVTTLDDWLDDMVEWLAESSVYYELRWEMGGEPEYTDMWSRDDLEAGPLTYPWEISA